MANFVILGKQWRDPTEVIDMDARFEFEESVSGGRCVIPRVDPFRDEAMKHMKNLSKLNCKIKGKYYGEIKGGKLHVTSDAIVDGYIHYIRRPKRGDFSVEFSEKIALKKPSTGGGRYITILSRKSSAYQLNMPLLNAQLGTGCVLL